MGCMSSSKKLGMVCLASGEIMLEIYSSSTGKQSAFFPWMSGQLYIKEDFVDRVMFLYFYLLH